MKRIGIVGGLSPESTIYYYKYITHRYTQQFGDYGYPHIIIYSVTFQDFVDWGKADDWKAIEDNLSDALLALEKTGADFAIIATNTMHYLYDSLVERTNIPILNLLEAVSEHAEKLGIKKLGLLGTKFTMTHGFYPNALSKVGVETIVPDSEDQKVVNDIIFHELTKGIITGESKDRYLKIIKKLVDKKAEGVILGCTEIPLLIKQEDLKIHVLDSSEIHAEAALKYALE
jgi:aspartate racemase